MRDPVREQLAGRAVPDAAVPQFVHELLDLPAATRQRREPRGSTTAADGARTEAHSARRSTSAIRASPLTIAAASSSGRGPGPGDQLADGGLADVELAERRQHVADVGEEGLVRPDHDHAAPPDLLAVRVEQVRDPVQPDRGLAGAGRALHADGLRRVGAHDSSWSGWMVATMSRIGPDRGRSISSIRIRLGRVTATGAERSGMLSSAPANSSSS